MIKIYVIVNYNSIEEVSFHVWYFMCVRFKLVTVLLYKCLYGLPAEKRDLMTNSENYLCFKNSIGVEQFWKIAMIYKR